MPLTINRVIVHELIKNKNEDPQPNNTRTSLLSNSNDSVMRLVEGIVSLYGRRNNSARYGVFEGLSTGGTFPPKFEKYLEEDNQTDDFFIDLSIVAMNELFRKAQDQPFATGGFVVFLDYFNENNERFYIVAMTKQKPQVGITDLEPESLDTIDLNKLHQAARVNYAKYHTYLASDAVGKSELLYLSFVSPKANKDAAGYFIKALGCSAGSTSEKSTTSAVKGSVSFFNDDIDLKPKARELKQALLKKFTDLKKEGVQATLTDIENVARQFFPPEANGRKTHDEYANLLHTYLNSEEVGVPYEFTVNAKALKKLTHITYNSAEFKIDFDKAELGSGEDARIQYCDGKLVINQLPPELRLKITDHLSTSN